jgi:hypothetical protein
LHERLFLVRFLCGTETLIGEDCCHQRIKIRNWDAQTLLAIQLDELITERNLIRDTLQHRDEHLQQIDALISETRLLEQTKLDFECEYPNSLMWTIRVLAKHTIATEPVGLSVWDGNAVQPLGALRVALDGLHELALHAPDEPDTDSFEYVRTVAQQCARIPDYIVAAKTKLEAGDAFFADENLDRLPRLMATETERRTVRRITLGRRRLCA